MIHLVTATATLALATSWVGTQSPTSQTAQTESLLAHESTAGVMGLSHPLETIPGVTRPIREVILAAPFDSVLTKLHVQEGDAVKAGQLIGTMDDRVARASLAMAELAANQTASIARARASLDRAQQRLDRTIAATRGGGANSIELENAQAEVAIAQAELGQTQEAQQAAALRMELAKAELAEREIRAPFSGTIIQTHTEDGTTLRVGDPIAEIADLTSQKVDLFMKPSVALDVEVGMSYALHVGSKTISATARFVEPRIDAASGTVRVAFEIVAQNQVPPPGSLARPVLASGELAVVGQ